MIDPETNTKLTKKEKQELRMKKYEEEKTAVRNEMERRLESLNIIYQLQKLNLSSKLPAIKTLLEVLNLYVVEGIEQVINIPFPEIQKVIVGKLTLHKNEDCEVILKHVDENGNIVNDDE